MNETITSLVESVETFSATEKGSTIHKYFEEAPSAKGVVITDDVHQPIGLIMRTSFYQMIGTQFGFSIYMNRPVKLLMNEDILCVDINCELSQFGFKAMNRSEATVYDFVIIMKENRYCGVVSISKFLTVMSEIKQREIELLNTQQRILEEAHEQERSLREEIQVKNQAIKSLLNNADQGFLSFNSDLVIHEEHSNMCNNIYNQTIAGMHFETLMGDYLEPSEYQLLVNTLSSVFREKKKSKVKSYIRLLPNEFIAYNRFIHIDYKMISFNYPKMLMVILTDVTDKKALEKKSEEEKNNMRLILSAINSKTEIIDAIEDAKQFFSIDVNEILNSGQPLTILLSELFRIIHTMKGDFALHQFHHTAFHLHKIEDKLSNILEHPESTTLSLLEDYMRSIPFETFIRDDLSIIQKFLGDNFLKSEKNITVNCNRIQTLLDTIHKRFFGDDKEFLMHHIKMLTYPALNSILLGYREYVQLLALKVGKKVTDLEVSGDIIYINREKNAKFLKSLIHIFRNIIDHGIELPEERIEKGKNEEGKLHCRISCSRETIALEISDDGKGIDSLLIGQKAVAKGIYSEAQIKEMTNDAIINTIFYDAFSTKESVSMLSGRGVGLSAVCEAVKGINGSIKVTSTIDVGTKFTIILPKTHSKIS